MPATTGFASKVRTSRLETVSTIRPSLQDVALGNSQYHPRMGEAINSKCDLDF